LNSVPLELQLLTLWRREKQNRWPQIKADHTGSSKTMKPGLSAFALLSVANAFKLFAPRRCVAALR
jgi:hypothetical protein